MVTVNEQIDKLINDLNEFLKSSLNTLNCVLNGMTLSRDLVSDDEKPNISLVIDKVSTVSDIISSFKIDTKNIAGSKQVRLLWYETGTSERFYYNNEENDLTEKMFNFILMSFDREVSQRLSIIEESNNGYIYFCTSIKDRLHKIITEYMTT